MYPVYLFWTQAVAVLTQNEFSALMWAFGVLGSALLAVGAILGQMIRSWGKKVDGAVESMRDQLAQLIHLPHRVEQIEDRERMRDREWADFKEQFRTEWTMAFQEVITISKDAKAIVERRRKPRNGHPHDP